ncbi:DUF6351 family protein [Actinomadura scrupuli]|uniref:DUF6351 family protein n=1 Tax=Actinomadura scrupuli TaxID=559629 RepID=UPI003D97A6AF
MSSRRSVLALLAAAALSPILGPVGPALAGGEPVHLEGTLPDGATYLIEKPATWNGTVLLFSHGYTMLGLPNPARNAPGTVEHDRLLARGYALIGSSYARNGWAAQEAVPDQLATLDTFERRFGRARRTIAWGQSYGGLVTGALAERHPARFDGALPLCGLMAGGNANWNSTLDATFAAKTLLAPGADVPLVRIGGQSAAFAGMQTMQAAIDRAQQSPAGRARIALAAALHDMPGWSDPSVPEPGPEDWAAQQLDQYQNLRGTMLPALPWRQEAETRAGGNMSWNTGIDYRRQLAASVDRDEVEALYRTAGLDLQADLKTLNSAPRISADRPAAEYMRRNVAFGGRLRIPLLTVHTTGDGLVPVQHERAYGDVARVSGSAGLLRQTYVHAAGHCLFTPAETLAALGSLEQRIATGRWGDAATPRVMNDRAAATGLGAGRFVAYRPAPYLRPFAVWSPVPKS